MGRPSIKEQLMERSQNLLITRGFNGVSVGDLVAAAGVPKGSFYNHFASKEQFAVEHVERYLRLLDLDALREPTGPAPDVIRHHFERQIAARRNGSMPIACLLGTLSTGISTAYPDLREAVRAAFELWINALAGLVDVAQVAGEIHSDVDPANVAAALVDGFEGALARAQVTGEGGPLDNFMRTTLEALIAKQSSA
jgi:TetR/AcrR family transcriptional regulator, transcriptional repressor for nem operon